MGVGIGVVDVSLTLRASSSSIAFTYSLADLQKKWMEQKENIFLTQPNENGVLPQASTYLALKDIDLSKYKKHAQQSNVCVCIAPPSIP